jgi:hypothetical protein
LKIAVSALTLLFLGMVTLQALEPVRGAASSSTTFPSKTWYFHGRPILNGPPYYYMNEYGPFVPSPHQCSGGGDCPLTGSTLSSTDPSTNFALDPGYANGLQILKEDVVVRISAMSTTDYASPAMPAPWSSTLNFRLATASDKAIASGSGSIRFDQWSMQWLGSKPVYVAYASDVFNVSTTETVFLAPYERANFGIALSNPSPSHNVTVTFDNNNYAVWSGITVSVGLYPTDLALSTSKDLVRYGDSVSIIGSLRNKWNNSAIHDGRIALYYLQYGDICGNFVLGQPFALLASITTSSSGEFAYKWTPPPRFGCYYLQASWNGTPYLEPSSVISSIIVDQAATQLSVQINPWYGVLTNAYKISGKLEGLNGSIPGENIVISYRVPGGSYPGTVITSAKTDSAGDYSAIWTPQATGNFTILATWEGSALQQSQQSQTILNVSNLYLGANLATITPPMVGAAAGGVFYLHRRRKTAGNTLHP